ncbi:hypothetical protein ACN2WE_05250 [Streptomyces sp. cg28]|uniref:hypothetical protein n=1 Tax=Streptomyces sp. cg28 TaxID=3403457 RepID=UPI003B220FCF
MSPFISSGDLGVTEIGRKARASMSVADASDAYAAQLISEFLAARADGKPELMQLIRDHAYAIDPALVDELDAIDYPAAA